MSTVGPWDHWEDIMACIWPIYSHVQTFSLAKTPQTRQGPELSALWLSVETLIALRPLLAYILRGVHTACSYGCLILDIFDILITTNFCVLNFYDCLAEYLTELYLQKVLSVSKRKRSDSVLHVCQKPLYDQKIKSQEITQFPRQLVGVVSTSSQSGSWSGVVSTSSQRRLWSAQVSIHCIGMYYFIGWMWIAYAWDVCSEPWLIQTCMHRDFYGPKPMCNVRGQNKQFRNVTFSLLEKGGIRKKT